MNRTRLQQLSNERIADAQALLGASQWSGAYYLAGYAVECALKSCILAHIERTGVIFEQRKFMDECWTHEINALIQKADLSAALGLAIAASSTLRDNVTIVKDWNETSRYRIWSQLQAEKLFSAVNDPTDGVLPWLKNHW